MSRATSGAPARTPVARVVAAATLILLCTGSLPVVPSGSLWPGAETAGAAVANALPIAMTVEPRRSCPRACAKSTRIWTMRPDGKGATPVTNPSGAYDRLPRWSPDGRHLAFTRVSAATGRSAIYVMRVVDGRFTAPRRVPSTATRWSGLGCEGEGMVAVWARGSQKLAFTCRKGDRSTIHVVWLHGARYQVVKAPDGFNDDSPSWVYGGRSLTFTRVAAAVPFGGAGRSSIWIVPIHKALGAARVLLSGPTALGQGTWSQKGRHLIYVERDERTLTTRLRLRDYWRGSDHALHTVTGTSTIYGPAWSTGGRWIAYAVGDGLARSTVKATYVTSGRTRTLSASNTIAFAPTWSPTSSVAFDAVSGHTSSTQQVVRGSVSKPIRANLPLTSGYTYDADWRPTA